MTWSIFKSAETRQREEDEFRAFSDWFQANRTKYEHQMPSTLSESLQTVRLFCFLLSAVLRNTKKEVDPCLSAAVAVVELCRNGADPEIANASQYLVELYFKSRPVLSGNDLEERFIEELNKKGNWQQSACSSALRIAWLVSKNLTDTKSELDTARPCLAELLVNIQKVLQQLS